VVKQIPPENGLRRIIMNEITTQEEFEKMTCNGTVLIDLFAQWCMPCHAMANIIDSLVAKHTNIKFCKIDIEKSPEIARLVKVSAVPTILIYKNGKEVRKIIGTENKKALDDILSSL
jgi:thioredoxin 1